MMRKLKSKSGETFIETLTALLIASLVLAFLTTAIVVGAKINNKIKTTDTSFLYPEETKDNRTQLTVTITADSDRTEKGFAEVYSYTDDSGYYHYYKEKG